MRRLACVVSLVLLGCIAGCGTQEVLLGTESTYLFTASDTLSPPSQPVSLKARVQAGDLLLGREGLIVRFYHNDRLYRVAETDRDGVASVTFTPQKEGDYTFHAELSPVGLEEAPPHRQSFLVACRNRETRFIVVDLDKTLVASGFQAVLIGDPQPMTGSLDVLTELSETHSIVYLTHRPQYFGPKSKAWLINNKYPSGPLLLSTLRGFLKGSRAFKSQQIQLLKETFPNIEMGMGDKVSDAIAYHENGLESFLIVQITNDMTAEALNMLSESLRELPEQVHVVSEWSQIRKVLAGQASYSPQEMRDVLDKMAEARQGDSQPPVKE